MTKINTGIQVNVDYIDDDMLDTVFREEELHVSVEDGELYLSGEKGINLFRCDLKSLEEN